MFRGLEHLLCEAKLGEPGEGSAKNLQQAIIQYLKGTYRKAGEGFLTKAYSDRTRHNAFKLEEGGFKLDILTKFP